MIIRIDVTEISFYCLLVKMRKGASGEEILDEITRVWQARDDRYSEERGRINALSAKRRVEMSYIGG